MMTNTISVRVSRIHIQTHAEPGCLCSMRALSELAAIIVYMLASTSSQGLVNLWYARSRSAIVHIIGSLEREVDHFYAAAVSIGEWDPYRG